MPQTGMDGWVIAGVIVALIGVFFAWKSVGNRKSGTTQTMTNSTRSKQEAAGDDITQTMDNVTDGDQKG